MHITNLTYRATVALDAGQPRSLEATAALEPGQNPEDVLGELHEWVEEQLFLLADLAADRRRPLGRMVP